jgi:hypothetical protein
MQRSFSLIAVCLFGIACSKALPVGGTDAGRDNGPVECVGPPPSDCAYDCQNGRWVRIPLLCLIPDAAVPDSALPDSALPDAAIPDSAIPDSAIPDSALPDSALPDSAFPDSAAPDSTLPDVRSNDTHEVGPQVTDANGAIIPDGPDARPDADTPAACANIARTWILAGSCLGPRSAFNGTLTAQMAQTGCKLTFTQTEDGTSTRSTATGVLESNGHGYLKGNFGFTDSGMCDLTVTTATSWGMVCSSATQQCKLEASPAPDLY